MIVFSLILLFQIKPNGPVGDFNQSYVEFIHCSWIFINVRSSSNELIFHFLVSSHAFTMTYSLWEWPIKYQDIFLVRIRKDREWPIRGVDIGLWGVFKARLSGWPLLQQHLLLLLGKMEELDGKDKNKENYKFLVIMYRLLFRGLISTVLWKKHNVFAIFC